jgi:hypothetical protein
MRAVAGLHALSRCGSRRQLLAYRALVVIGLVCCAGCGGSNTYPVRGKLVWPDGSPITELAGGSVQFESEKLTPNVSARGEIQEDGTFRLGTNKPDDGAPAGEYKVLVMQPLNEASDHPQPKAKIVHERFANFNTSGLRATVEPKSNDITLKLERAPARKSKG